MPLPLPTLDKLTYDELVGDGRASLPALAPNWTDYNAHDPGITLLELLAWLTESNSYRLDRIPEQSYRAFLRLAGVEAQPAQLAQTALVFTAGGTSAQLRADTLVQSSDGKTRFQTTLPLFVTDARLRTLLGGTEGGLVNHGGHLSEPGADFLPLGASPRAGDAFYLGFDRKLAPEGTEVQLWFWTGNEVQDRDIRARLQQEEYDARAEIEFLRSSTATANLPSWRQHYSVQTVWEYYAGNHRWIPLGVVRDDTRALTLTGCIRIKAPAPGVHEKGVPGLGAPDNDNYFIRCRIVKGQYDCPPRMTWVAINAVLARHAADAPAQRFVSNGRAGQRLILAQTPVVPGSTSVVLRVNGVADEPWRQARNWDGSGPHDRTYVLDAASGSITFGDGRFGRVPPADAKIVLEYQAGGGVEGNVAAKTLHTLTSAPSGVIVKQYFAALGGVAAESMNAAKARAVRELSTPTRAVTLDDFEWLALHTPGVPVARAHAIADYHPGMPCVPVSGSTTVVVLPPCPDHLPTPGNAMRHAVALYLCRRRLLASEVHVVAPSYTTVSVSARLHASPLADRRQLVQQANKALDEFFHPLRGGPDKTGWPVGRAVYRSELLALLNGIEGVVYVEDMAWQVAGDDPSRCGNITICAHGLLASGDHEISVNEGSTCRE